MERAQKNKYKKIECSSISIQSYGVSNRVIKEIYMLVLYAVYGTDEKCMKVLKIDLIW